MVLDLPARRATHLSSVPQPRRAFLGPSVAHRWRRMMSAPPVDGPNASPRSEFEELWLIGFD